MPFGSERDHFKRKFTGLNADEAEALVEIEFTECVFEKCILSGMAFQHCAFIDCRFISCDLSGITVKDTKFMQARFTDSKAIGINWTVASPFNLTLEFERCVVDYSVFFGLKIAKFKLERSRAYEVDFQEAQLKDASFQESDLLGSKFMQTDLRGATFKRAQNYAIHPKFNKLGDTVFSFPEALALLKPMGILIDSLDERGKKDQF
jgi:uncharacterized protein YjbI with pentapeptide repeats